MRHLTVVLIPEGNRSTRHIRIPKALLRVMGLCTILVTGLVGYLILDYVQLRAIRSSYFALSAENEGLKGEARLLISNLEDVKRSLRRVQDYSAKLGKLVNLQVKKVSKKTGIGPLSPDEARAAHRQNYQQERTAGYVPLGIDIDKLTFHPVLEQMDEIHRQSDQNAMELQQLLSNLSQKKSLLSSVPSISPVNGWITSGFGGRISPFTGTRTWHSGRTARNNVSPVIKLSSATVARDGSVVLSGGCLLSMGAGVLASLATPSLL